MEMESICFDLISLEHKPNFIQRYHDLSRIDLRSFMDLKEVLVSEKYVRKS